MTACVLTTAEPGAVGLAADLTARLDRTVTRQLRRTRIPGAAVLVACAGAVVHHGCYGSAQDHDENGPLPVPRAVTRDTVFDVASLTKVVATTAVAMHLVDRGRLALDDPVERYLPRPGNLAGVRIRDLLEHRAGLPPWQPLYLWASQPEGALRRICALERPPAGVRRIYSDLSMMVLGAVAERAGESSLEDLTATAVTRPLGLSSTGFRPAGDLMGRCAATSTGNRAEQRMVATGDPVPVDGRPEDFTGWREHTLVGEVNDGNAAYAFEGVAGHAGLFSTAGDLALFGQTLLQGGRYGDTQVWRPSTVQAFAAPGADPDQGLGFWCRRLAALGAAGDQAPSYGHRGYTGCELIVAPRRQLVLVLLSNRLHTEDDPPTDDAPLWRAVVETVLAG